MSELMLHGVLNMPLPNDPKELELFEWVQFRDRARQASERIKELEAENARLREALIICEAEIDGYIRQEYPADHPVHDWYRVRDFAANPARAALKQEAGGE